MDASLIVPNNSGLFFYSKTGANDFPWQGGYLCIAPPARRTVIAPSLRAGQRCRGGGLVGLRHQVQFGC